jgi:hypothetical protein
MAEKKGFANCRRQQRAIWFGLLTYALAQVEQLPTLRQHVRNHKFFGHFACVESVSELDAFFYCLFWQR